MYDTHDLDVFEYPGLFPDDVKAILPEIGSQDGLGKNAIAHVKFFTPDADWTWYATEGEPVVDEDGNEVDYEFFGYVVGEFPEWGPFTLSQLEAIRGPIGLAVERDMWWEPTPMEDCPGFTP